MLASIAPVSLDEEGLLRSRVTQEQFALVLQSNTSSRFTAFAIALIFWVFLYARLGTVLVLAWATAMHAGQAMRFFWVRRYRAAPVQAASDRRWIHGYILLLGINGATWGAAPLLFFPPDDILLLAFMVIVILGVYAGGMAWMAPVKAAVLAFGVPIMVTLSISLLTRDDITFKVAGVLTFFYLFSSWKAAMHHHKMLTDALIARFEKIALAEKLEEQVALVQKASLEKSRFLAAASHDLRQPLHAIALFSAVLEKELRSGPQHEDASRLLKAVRSLGASLDTMLDISRLDAGVVRYDIVPMPLNTVFQSLNNVFSAQASERGIELRLRATPLWVHSDAPLLQRMLANLVGNALKYTPEGGVIVVARARGDKVWIDVRDTGIGIAPEQMHRIFDEFYQVNNPGRDRTQGLGIGLAIVRRLSVLLRIPIHVHSATGSGSRFRLVLPAADPMRPPTRFDPLASGKFARPHALPRRVLVLDDEADILVAIGSLLKSYGVDVKGVGTEQEALHALLHTPEQARYEVLLCDFRLANGEDGLNFAMRLPRHMEIPPSVILITGETAPERLQRVRDSGIRVLFKPVVPDELLHVLTDPATYVPQEESPGSLPSSAH